MKRSNAPSLASSKTTKKPRFTTPWAKNSTDIKVPTEVHVLEIDEKLMDTEFIGEKDLVFEQSNEISSDNNVATLSNDKEESFDHYYKVMWCKLSKKKHKTWEGDAVLITHGRTATLKDTEGKVIGHSTGYKSSVLSSLSEGSTLIIGGKEIEIMSVVSREEWLSGNCFSSFNTSSTPVLESISQVKKKFTNPLKESIKMNTKLKQTYQPQFDPTADGALVLTRPNHKHQLIYNTQGLPVVDVVVDPRLAKHLRAHQREGVLFLYECVMDMRDYVGCGAILADEMGLGKTLQTITLIWTLLRQGPYGGKPVVKRAIVITPGSLVKNWQREFDKWLGHERLKTFAASSDNRPEDFVRSPVYPVLIISYELFMKCYNVLSSIKFDIVICDEGHRLKNTSIKTFSLLSSLPSNKRIVLSGTPIQNDLMEFYALSEFCNPGLLGTQAGFHKIFEQPISQSYQIEASEEEKEIGKGRCEELMRLASLFYLRRTQEINSSYLPSKVENVIFCRLSPLQISLYQSLLSSQTVQSCLSSSISDFSYHLVCINALKKLCNSPSLLYPSDSGQSDIFDCINSCYPDDYDPGECLIENSGKLWVLSAMLEYLHFNGQEKIVIVSNYTQTLDILEKLCKMFNYSFLRLDGHTPTAKRQSIVDRFNNKHIKDFVFLLSSKAGGVGLNLIGASRLILYDIDWNPANDLQAMARVWRDGQTRKVYIYRLLATGTIEEKIFQRQVSKQTLSNAIENKEIDNGQSSSSKHVQFTIEDLHDLFVLDVDSECVTHDQLNCCCQQEDKEKTHHDDASDTGDVRASLLRFQTKDDQVKHVSIDKLNDWQHISSPFTSTEDNMIIHAASNITFVIRHEHKS